MTALRVLLSRVFSLFRKRRLEQELDDELQFHMEREVAHQAAQGLSPEEARQVAMKRFGHIDGAKETYRDTRGIRVVESFLQDVRYGLRNLRQNPGFTAVAVLSLALGIGANTAVFTIVNAALLTPLPVNDPAGLVTLAVIRQGRPAGAGYPTFQAIASAQQGLAEIAASGSMRLTHVVVDGQELQELNSIRGAWVSANYFGFLGLDPAAGRLFTPSDSPAPGQGAVAVISHDMWQNRFAASAGVIGKTIVLDRVPLTIVGVAPRGFLGDRQPAPTDIWVPMFMQPRFGRNLLVERQASWFRMLGRLNPDVPVAQVNAELTGLYRRDVASAGAYRGNIEELRMEAQSFGSGLMPQERGALGQPLRLLMAVVGLVLLIACFNVANLLLARGSARRREIGIRLAVGCSRYRLIAQLMTESALLCIFGGALGYSAAFAGTRILAGVSSGIVPATLNLRPDARVLAFTVGISVIAGILFGLVPALQTTSLKLDPGLRGSRIANRSRQHTSRILVVAQVALSLWLLIGAALMVRTLQNLRSVDVGLDHERVLSMFVTPEPSVKPPQIPDLRARIHERLKALPGIEHVSFSTYGLFASGMTTAPIRVPGSRVDPARDPDVRESWVTAEFFETMGLKVLLGRRLTESDAGAPVGVINEVIARAYFGDQNPLGKLIYFPKIDSQNRYVPFGEQLDREQAIEIVGVVADTRESFQEAPIRMVYMPIERRPDLGNALYVRTSGDPDLHKAEILRVMREFNQDIAVTSMTTLDEWVERLLGEQRLLARLLTIFGTLALVLAAVGLFGVMAYAVVRRTAEIGVRMALGARRSGVVVMILREATILALAGVALGVPAVLASSRLLSRLLFGLKATDPITIGAVSAGLLVVAVLAGYVPARRASRVDPLIALRHD